MGLRSKAKTAMIKDLRSEYRFDYRKARPNRFASQPKASSPKSRRRRTVP